LLEGQCQDESRLKTSPNPDSKIGLRSLDHGKKYATKKVESFQTLPLRIQYGRLSSSSNEVVKHFLI
jgi:hypothetical protein